MSKILLNIDRELKVKLKIIAAKKDCTVTALIIDAIRKLVDNN